ncbi:cytidylate kinase family protein [Kribbella sp. NPDC049174]|uniref:cytidylate kinase family protein n=1 Tax=Kribbella sp. NPDC049174 TaxID=3364112 RepID=UPI003713A899
MDNGTRSELLSRLAEAVGSVANGHPTRVALDGPPAVGKTTLADELAVVLRAQGRDVIRATIEEFLTPRSQRYRRGEDSAEGCYHDSFDFDALHRVLLDPLGPGGDRRFQQAVYDKVTDTALSESVMTAPADAVLLFDGVFLMRPELIDRWDLRIFVSAAFEKTLARARTRDQTSTRSATEVERRYRSRYIPSQQFYFDTVRPTDHADIIVHNDDPQHPAWEARQKATNSQDESP